MNPVLSHVVRRGVDYAQGTMRFTAVPAANAAPNDSDAFKSGQNAGDILKQLNIPTAYAIFLGVMVVILTLVSVAMNYTLTHVIATLTMVESPSADAYMPLETDVDDPDNKTDTVPELLLVKQPMITSKIRLSLRHLRSVGGFWAPFRGAGIYLFNSFVTVRLAEAIYWVVGGGLVGISIATIVSSVIFARLSMVWTHIVISEPSPKRWYQRLGGVFKDGKWKKVAGPTAVLAVAREVAVALPLFLASKSGLQKYMDPEKMQNITRSEATPVILTVLGISLLSLALHVLIVIPAKVTLIRVQASLLNDEEETIVPFDRSFGGKVVPAIVGGSGVIGALDAWKTFNWASRIRLMKLYFKILCINVFMHGFVTLAIVFPAIFLF